MAVRFSYALISTQKMSENALLDNSVSGSLRMFQKKGIHSGERA